MRQEQKNSISLPDNIWLANVKQRLRLKAKIGMRRLESMNAYHKWQAEHKSYIRCRGGLITEGIPVYQHKIPTIGGYGDD